MGDRIRQCLRLRLLRRAAGRRGAPWPPSSPLVRWWLWWPSLTTTTARQRLRRRRFPARRFPGTLCACKSRSRWPNMTKPSRGLMRASPTPSSTYHQALLAEAARSRAMKQLRAKLAQKEGLVAAERKKLQTDAMGLAQIESRARGLLSPKYTPNAQELQAVAQESNLAAPPALSLIETDKH